MLVIRGKGDPEQTSAVKGNIMHRQMIVMVAKGVSGGSRAMIVIGRGQRPEARGQRPEASPGQRPAEASGETSGGQPQRREITTIRRMRPKKIVR